MPIIKIYRHTFDFEITFTFTINSVESVSGFKTTCLWSCVSLHVISCTTCKAWTTYLILISLASDFIDMAEKYGNHHLVHCINHQDLKLLCLWQNLKKEEIKRKIVVICYFTLQVWYVKYLGFSLILIIEFVSTHLVLNCVYFFQIKVAS